MRHKNVNFKFKKKSLKSLKISDDKNIKDFDEYYSKIFLNCFESDKHKEESKNNNIDGIFKFNKNKKTKLSSNTSNKILKISLYEENKFHKKNNADIINNNDPVTKERKTANLNKKFLAKKIIQSISEKNIKRDNTNNYKSNANLNTDLYSQRKKNDLNNNTIKLNLNNNNNNNNINKHVQKPQNIISNIVLNNINNNNNKERKNKSLDKRKERKVKNIGDKKKINLRININEMANNKKYNFHFIHNNKNNKININKSLNKRSIKSNINKSPEINFVNNNLKEKNLNKIKKIINTDADSNSKISNKKKIKKVTDNYSSKNIFDKNPKINSLKKHIIEKKGTKNIILNSSNSKLNNTTKQQATFRRIKVESIKIDLNVINPPKNYSFISQEKTTAADNHILNDKNNLTVRNSEITKFNNKNLELNLAVQETSELNRSVKTSFSVNKTRSLSKKRDEKKRSKMNNLEGSNNTEENNRKLNNILISLSNIRINTEKEFIKKSEPKKLIDKIRKFKKLQNCN